HRKQTFQLGSDEIQVSMAADLQTLLLQGSAALETAQMGISLSPDNPARILQSSHTSATQVILLGGSLKEPLERVSGLLVHCRPEKVSGQCWPQSGPDTLKALSLDYPLEF